MKIKEHFDTSITTLGSAKIASPIKVVRKQDEGRRFVSDNERILINIDENEVMKAAKSQKKPLALERAGPRPVCHCKLWGTLPGHK